MEFNYKYNCQKCRKENNCIVNDKNVKKKFCYVGNTSLLVHLMKCEHCGTINVVQVDNTDTNEKLKLLKTKIMISADMDKGDMKKSEKVKLQKEIRNQSKNLDEMRKGLLKKYRKFFKKNLDMLESLWYNE